MTTNPVAAPVEERHWQAAVDTNHTTRDIAQRLANTEAAIRAEERQKAMETAWDEQSLRNAIMEGLSLWDVPPRNKGSMAGDIYRAIRRAFEEKEER